MAHLEDKHVDGSLMSNSIGVLLSVFDVVAQVPYLVRVAGWTTLWLPRLRPFEIHSCFLQLIWWRVFNVSSN